MFPGFIVSLHRPGLYLRLRLRPLGAFALASLSLFHAPRHRILAYSGSHHTIWHRMGMFSVVCCLRCRGHSCCYFPVGLCRVVLVLSAAGSEGSGRRLQLHTQWQSHGTTTRPGPETLVH